MPQLRQDCVTTSWFLMRFLGKENEINLNTEYPEFCEWMWASPQNAIELIIDFKKNIYKEVINTFLNCNF